MWPYLQNQRKPGEPGGETRRRPLDFAELVAQMGDLSDLSEHDVFVKFWLPQPVADALRELRQLRAESTSEILRQFFIAHCYGFYVLQWLVARRPEVFKDIDAAMDARFSRRCDPPGPVKRIKKRIDVYFVPEFGKNVAPMKIWMAQRLHDDLMLLAAHTGLKLSQYLREIVISRLLGHGALPMRPEMLNAVPTPAADDWCEDKPIPWREVSYAEYRQHPEGRWESRELDEYENEDQA